MSRVRIVLADDHTLVRAGLRKLLEALHLVCGNNRVVLTPTGNELDT